MLDNNNFLQCATAASSAYASMAAFTAAANMYNSFCPATNIQNDPVNYYGCSGNKHYFHNLNNNSFSILEIIRERLDPQVSVKLEQIDLWKSFYSLGTEMIITK